MTKKELSKLLRSLPRNTKIQLNGEDDIIVTYWMNNEGRCGINLCNSPNVENVEIKTFSNSENLFDKVE